MKDDKEIESTPEISIENIREALSFFKNFGTDVAELKKRGFEYSDGQLTSKDYED